MPSCLSAHFPYPRECPPLQSRVLHGVRQEILALSEIPFVKVRSCTFYLYFLLVLCSPIS